MFRAFLNYSVGRVHCCISEEISGNENSWELVLLWEQPATGSLGVTLGLAGINYLPLSQPMNFLPYLSPWTAKVKEWESSLVGTCQPDKVNPPEEWKSSHCASCLTLRHFSLPSACAQHQEHGRWSSSTVLEPHCLLSFPHTRVKQLRKTQQPCTFWPCGKYLLDFLLCLIISARSERLSTSVIQNGL